MAGGKASADARELGPQLLPGEPWRAEPRAAHRRHDRSRAGGDSRHPADVVTGMVDHVLRLTETWPRWDGRPCEVSVEGEQPRICTPHKAIGRVTDHLADHLAEFEARLAGQPTEPDRWHAS